MLIRGATVFGADFTDVRWSDARITECGVGLRRLPGEEVVDARGGWLLPGLHDHHVHLRALAATADSIRLGPSEIQGADGLADALRRAAANSPAGAWIRGVGYHESGAGELNRQVLDRMLPDRPVRVQHRSGALWILNSRACAEAGVDDCELPGVERTASGAATGRLWRMDSWLSARIGTRPQDLAQLSARAAAWGITGFTDATPNLRQPDIDDLARAVGDGRIVQRVHCMAPPGIRAPAAGRFSLGPTKILLDDDTLPSLDDFAAIIRATHAESRPVAVHCVTRVQLALTMAALDTAGHHAGDRIEHGAVIPEDAFEWIRRHHITIVTQPHFVVERRAQYLRDVPPADRRDLWRLGSLLAAGLNVAASTDAPFGGADPWSVVRAASARGPFSTAAESISTAAAVRLFFGRPDRPAALRRIAPGTSADLILLTGAPGSAMGSNPVRATVIGGSVVYRADQIASASGLAPR